MTPGHAVLCGIAAHLPARLLTAADLQAAFPDYPIQKIAAKTGIRELHVADEEECASDLAVAAARALFSTGVCFPEEIDYLLLCTQTPDYLVPTTACLVQNRLGLRKSVGAFDINLGCSGFVYGLGVAASLIESGQAGRVLLLTADTYSRLLNPRDRSVRLIFGDGAAATLICSDSANEPSIGPFVYMTDGSGGPDLIVPASGLRQRRTPTTAEEVRDGCGNWRSAEQLYMNGPRIFEFALETVPQAVKLLLAKAALSLDSVDLFVFHQANAVMLEELRQAIGIPREKYVVFLAHCGNTVSSSIPIALGQAIREGRLKTRMRVVLVGFGAGYSCAAAVINWRGSYDSTSFL